MLPVQSPSKCTAPQPRFNPSIDSAAHRNQSETANVPVREQYNRISPSQFTNCETSKKFIVNFVRLQPAPARIRSSKTIKLCSGWNTAPENGESYICSQTRQLYVRAVELKLLNKGVRRRWLPSSFCPDVENCYRRAAGIVLLEIWRGRGILGRGPLDSAV